ncbi:ABC transporter substrate-binding protein [Streptomyces thermocoprophilus]
MHGARYAKRVACAAAVALAATACGGGDSDGGGSDGAGVLSASWGDPQNPLEPANTNEVQGGKVLDMIFRGLKRYNPETGAAEDMLAEKIETSDSQNFTITIKDGWTFQNGEKVTAKSFVDAWNYGAGLKNNQRNAYFFGYIEGYDQVHPEDGSKQTADTMSGLKVVDDKTFTVKLTQKFSTFPDTLGYPAFAPLPQSFFTDHAGWIAKPVGNGPYQIDSYAKGSQMSLRKWDQYPGDDKAQNGGVDLKVYTDNNTAYTDLIAGNLDLVDDVPASQLKNVNNDLQGRYLNTPAGIIQTLAFPFYDPQWNKADSDKVRKGLSMAINRKQITDTIFQKTRTPRHRLDLAGAGQGGRLPGRAVRGVLRLRPGAGEEADPGGRRPAGRAGEDLVQRGHRLAQAVGGRRLQLHQQRPRQRQGVRGQPGRHVRRLPHQDHAEKKMTGPFRAGWQMDYPLIQNFLQPLYYTNASSNDGKWSNKEFDSLVDQANQETDTGKAIQLFQQAEEVVRDNMAAIPLWYQNGSAGWSDRLSNVKLNPFSVPVYNEIKVG